MTTNRSIAFFDAQFAHQVRDGDFVLNPFEALALPFLHGDVLDLGSGLGNLAIEAARSGCCVTALDAGVTAIQRINDVATTENLLIDAKLVDLTTYRIAKNFDVIVSIGLLMFMERRRALNLLAEIQSRVKPGGSAILNVLIEGTTYLEMFEPGEYCLFSRTELLNAFVGWELLESRYDSFEAPGQILKAFATLIARKRHA